MAARWLRVDRTMVRAHRASLPNRKQGPNHTLLSNSWRYPGSYHEQYRGVGGKVMHFAWTTSSGAAFRLPGPPGACVRASRRIRVFVRPGPSGLSCSDGTPLLIPLSQAHPPGLRVPIAMRCYSAALQWAAAPKLELGYTHHSRCRNPTRP
jgi:hypothetical protein